MVYCHKLAQIGASWMALLGFGYEIFGYDVSWIIPKKVPAFLLVGGLPKHNRPTALS